MERQINMGFRNLKPKTVNMSLKLIKWECKEFQTSVNWTNGLSKSSFDKIFYNENNIDIIRIDMDAIFYYFSVPSFELLEIYPYMFAPVIITIGHFKLKFYWGRQWLEIFQCWKYYEMKIPLAWNWTKSNLDILITLPI